MSRSRLPPKRTLDTSTLAGMIKARLWDLDVTIGELAAHLNLQPGTLRGRLSKCRGKRALQPHQCTIVANVLGLDPIILHRLGAKQEGWKIDDANGRERPRRDASPRAERQGREPVER